MNQCNSVLLWSHRLLPEQAKDLHDNWNIKSIFELDLEKKTLWSQVPTTPINIETYAKPIIQWLESITTANDIIVVQGEYGLSYYVVNWCFQHQLKPVYALTERRSVETVHEGTVQKTSVFAHAGFRLYQAYKNKD